MQTDTVLTFVDKEEEGLLILMDRLGTKGIWKENNPRTTIDEWIVVMRAIEKYFVENFEEQKYDIKFTIFSDTVLISIFGKDKEKLILDVGAALIWFMSATMTNGLHFRGCLSYGLIIRARNSIIGPAIDEAAEYHTLQQWVGISAAPSVHKILEKIDQSKLKLGNEGQRYVQYDIPLKNSTEKNGWAINWPIRNSWRFIIQKKEFSSLEQYIEYNLEKETAIPHVFKWRNTLDFLRQFK